MRLVLRREQPEADGRLARLLTSSSAGTSSPSTSSRPRCARVVEWLPFRYQIGLPVEIMTGAHDRADALALLGAQWALGRRGLASRRSCGAAACAASPPTGGDIAMLPLRSASSACSSARRCSSGCSTAPTSCSTGSSDSSGRPPRSCRSSSSSARARRSRAGASARR